MRISTKQAEALAAATSRREETYASPFGAGRLVTSGDLPLEVGLPGETTGGVVSRQAHSRWALLLGRYFAGERVTFDLDVEAYAVVVGLTVFERDVYAALGRVPYGTVVSYRELAAAAGRPRAYRAVGSAMARNRLPVILPCHRVVRNDGRLGAYGDDPAWKERLLELEGVEVKGGGSHDGRTGVRDRHGPFGGRQVAGHGCLRRRGLVLHRQPAAAIWCPPSSISSGARAARSTVSPS